MSGPATRPASLKLPAIVRRAFETERGAWGTIAAAAAVVLIPGAVLQGLVENEAVDQTSSPVLFAVLALAGGASGILGYFFLNGVIAQVALARRSGSAHPSFGTIARGLPWGHLIVADLLLTLGTAIGLVLLIFPGVVFVTRFGLAPVLIETHHLEVRPAFERSREITRGRFRLVLACFLVPLVLVAAGSYPIHLLIDAILPLPEAVEWSLAALLVGIAVKPFASVVTVELAIELDEATPASHPAQ